MASSAASKYYDEPISNLDVKNTQKVRKMK